jgi:hypothetical protein
VVLRNDAWVGGVPRVFPRTGSAQTGDGAAGCNTIKPGLHGDICRYIWRVGYTHIAALGVLSSRLVSLSPYVTVNTMLFIASFRLLKSVKTRVSLVYVCVCACPGLGSMADTLQQRHPAQWLEEACRSFSFNLFRY